jgi:hypothetical protein
VTETNVLSDGIVVREILLGRIRAQRKWVEDRFDLDAFFFG